MGPFTQRRIVNGGLAAVVAAVAAGCASNDPYQYGGYQATVVQPGTGQYVSQPGEIVKKYHWFGRAPTQGEPVPGCPNTVWGNPNPGGFGGGDGDVLPAVGWRWANPNDLGDKRVVPAR
jgi:hypothetical protein